MNPTDETHSEPRRKRQRWLGPVVVLGALGIGAAFWLTAPKPERRPSDPRQPLVTVLELRRVDHRIEVELHGRVEPVTRIDLVPEVAGRVTRVHASFVPGGRVPAYETLVGIDEREYVAGVEMARAAVDTAVEELHLEEGRRRVAHAEWKQFANESAGEQGRDLATRGPQLRMRKADVQRAKASLRRAELDLERCRIRLPYPVVVESIDVAAGSVARPGDVVGRVYPIGALWVRASLPVEQLRWFSARADEQVSVWPSGAIAPLGGTIREILPNVERQGSLGQLLIEVSMAAAEDANADRLPLRVDEFVRVSVRGRVLEGVFVLPRRAVRGEAEVWLVDDEQRLVIRTVMPLFASRDHVIVRDGLADGQRVIVSQMEQPVQGMRLRIDEKPASLAAETPVERAGDTVMETRGGGSVSSPEGAP